MNPARFCAMALVALAIPMYAATNLIFIHHSVGQNWLDVGQLSSRLDAAGFAVHEATYGSPVPGTSPLSPIGDYTDICHWYYWFNNHLEGVLGWQCTPGESNMIVMFKSCFPNSVIYEDGSAPGDPTNEYHTLWNDKAAYLSLTNAFALNSSVMFIACTAPPCKPGDGYEEANAPRGRTFNDWLRTDFVTNYYAATGLRNLAVFDVHDVLASSRLLKKKASALAPRLASRDSHPNPKGSRELTGSFLPFFRNALGFWASGEGATNAILKGATAKYKAAKGSLQLSGWADSIGAGMPGTARIIVAGTVVQTFDAATWRAQGTGYKAVAAAPNGKTAMLKLGNKDIKTISFKGYAAGPLPDPAPVIIDLGNGQVFALDLLLDEKGMFP